MAFEDLSHQEHGYRNGHQLLSSTVRLAQSDQDVVDRLSDIAGPLRPGQLIAPYFTFYPLPSGSRYVVSRTWQDTAAPRAGCVLTKSLFIPIDEWRRSEDLLAFANLLSRPPYGADIGPGPQMPPLTLSPVLDSRGIELMEALFLEAPAPTVVFEAQEPDIIAIRLLTALWPAWRSRFAICTYALAPRRLEDRDFDLMFAPKSARSRFTEWGGRRIEVASRAQPRHRWSSLVAENVLKSDNPNLAAADTLGALREAGAGDSSALRLSLLWAELNEKVPSNPMALLGMLDVLRSLSPNSRRIGFVISALERALAQAQVAMPPREAWRYATTLAAKMAKLGAGTELVAHLGPFARDLAERDPIGAWLFLQEETFSSIESDFLFRCIGDGLSVHLDKIATSDEILIPAPSTIAKLMNASGAFAEESIEIAIVQPQAWRPVVEAGLACKAPIVFDHIRRRMIKRIHGKTSAPILGAILQTSREDLLIDAANHIGEETGFAYPAFDRPLLDSIRTEHRRAELRERIASFRGAGTQRLLSKLLRFDTHDIDWLVSGAVDPLATRQLLAQLLNIHDDRKLSEVFSDNNLLQRAIDILLVDVNKLASTLARLLLIPEISVASLLSSAPLVFTALPHPARRQFADRVLARAMEEAETSELTAIVVAMAPLVEMEGLVRLATAPTVGRYLGRNLVVLDSLPAPLRREILPNIDELTDRVASSNIDLGPDGYLALSRMIDDSGQIEPSAQLRASIIALSYSLQHPHRAVSPLVVSSFPSVYAQLLRSTGDNDFGLIPSLLLLPFSFFVDWDRAKSARRDLVKAYLGSTWPPSDLLQTAMQADIDQTILQRLLREPGGNNYFVKIERDVTNRSPRERAALENALNRFAKSGGQADWD